MSRLSIIGMYNYDPDVFADFTVPEGLQKQDVIDAILLECAGLELLYPSLNIMKVAIRAWTVREFPTWEKLQNTVSIEYNPLWNVDATISETGTNTKERSGSESNTRERGGSESNTRERSGEGSDDGTDTHAVKGYNSSNWSDSDKVTKNSDQTWSDEESGNQTWSDEESGNQTWSDEENGSDTRSIRRTGNIGVTSSQELIKQEREIASFNVTDYIVRSFKNRFCLLVY